MLGMGSSHLIACSSLQFAGRVESASSSFAGSAPFLRVFMPKFLQNRPIYANFREKSGLWLVSLYADRGFMRAGQFAGQNASFPART